jgi:hypothetical protein
MLNIIKQAAVEAVEAASPVQVLFGTVSGAAPWAVRVDQRFTLTERFLLLTDTAQKAGLSIGDIVLLLRVQGGQKYVILDKVGGAT